MKIKMDIKKLLVSFMVLVSVLFLAASVSAAELADNTAIEVNGIDATFNPAIVVGETLFVRVEFDSLATISDVIVKAEIEGDRKTVEAQTSYFDVEAGKRYSKTLKLDVPFDLRDKLSGYVDLNVRISGNDFRTDISYSLRVQRESYSVDVISVSIPQQVTAGELFPVDFVLRNIGYNDLRDLFVTAKISALNVERNVFLGNIVAIECDKDMTAEENYGVDIVRKCIEDKESTVSGRIFIQLPYDAQPGIYALELKIAGEDVASSDNVQLVVKNAFPEGNFIVSGNQLLIANPTNELIVYRIMPQSTSAISVSVSETLVAVPAGSSRVVTADATSDLSGTQTYSVNVFSSDGAFLSTVSFTKSFGEKDVTSPIVVLTIVLAVIFIVLLVVLIVLLGKKPQKSEEFSESYY